MKMKTIGIITFSVVIVTGLWIITMILNAPNSSNIISINEKIVVLKSAGILYYVTYLNAALITILTVAMYSGFCLYCKDKDYLWSVIAFSFVPIYGFGNLVVYLSQIFVVPSIVELHSIAEYELFTEFLLSQIIQDWPESAIGYLNGVSYGILGIPSIILPFILLKKDAKLRIGSLLLILSGILSITALVGLALRNQFLIFMLVLSGIIYFVALIFIGIYFFQQTEIK